MRAHEKNHALMAKSSCQVCIQILPGDVKQSISMICSPSILILTYCALSGSHLHLLAQTSRGLVKETLAKIQILKRKTKSIVICNLFIFLSNYLGSADEKKM
jgi:hypothetical protein